MKSPVNNDRQFELDVLGKLARASVLCSERRRPEIDLAAALRTDWTVEIIKQAAGREASQCRVAIIQPR